MSILEPKPDILGAKIWWEAKSKKSEKINIDNLLPKNEFYDLQYTPKCWKLNKEQIGSVGFEILKLL